MAIIGKMDVEGIGDHGIQVKIGDASACLRFEDGEWVLSSVDGGSIRLEVGGGEDVVVDKLFGPLVMCGLKVVADKGQVQWVISRDAMNPSTDPEWHEAARVDAWYDGDGDEDGGREG